MKLLILDDDWNRHETFDKKFAGYSIRHTETAADTIAYLDISTYDFIFLDHDLGGEAYVQSGAGTGYEVAQYLAKTVDRHKGSTIIVHTWNTAGARNMQSILEQAGYTVVVDVFPCNSIKTT